MCDCVYLSGRVCVYMCDFLWQSVCVYIRVFVRYCVREFVFVLVSLNDSNCVISCAVVDKSKNETYMKYNSRHSFS